MIYIVGKMAYHETSRCLTERETMQRHGLDDFLKAIKPLVDEPQSYNMDEYHMINLIITSGITL